MGTLQKGFCTAESAENAEIHSRFDHRKRSLLSPRSAFSAVKVFAVHTRVNNRCGLMGLAQTLSRMHQNPFSPAGGLNMPHDGPFPQISAHVHGAPDRQERDAYQ